MIRKNIKERSVSRTRSTTVTPNEVAALITELTGQRAPLAWGNQANVVASLFQSGAGIGWTQFNEVLLLLGYDRVTARFFQYLTDGTMIERPRASIRSIKQFRDGIQRVREMSLLFYGNVKFGFKVLSQDRGMIAVRFAAMQVRGAKTFSTRYEPVKPIEVIPGQDTYFLGYLIEKQLKRQLDENPNDPQLLADEAKRQKIVEIGKRNHNAYLASDHLDIYVATSMRAQHEYLEIAKFAKNIFQHPILRRLKLRWFDPTQAYCKDRVDKGLAEALMLKRAKCTLYLVQETDTLGKDSELASTLAQGKPVIAFVPKADAAFVNERIKTLKQISKKSDITIVLEQLQLYAPALAWTDPEVQSWLAAPDNMDLAAAKSRLISIVKQRYDDRARILKEEHPLGIQVQLETGVANGVLIVRTIDDCAELIRRVVTGGLKYRIEKYSTEESAQSAYYLRETVSDSIYRVMSGDLMLANAFWNFYLKGVDDDAKNTAALHA